MVSQSEQNSTNPCKNAHLIHRLVDLCSVWLTILRVRLRHADPWVDGLLFCLTGKKIIKKSHETVPVMTKHLLAGAKNTLSQCHTGKQCHTGTNYSYPGIKLNNIFPWMDKLSQWIKSQIPSKWCGHYITCDNSSKQAQTVWKIHGTLWVD